MNALILAWRHVVQRRMQTLSIVKNLAVLKNCRFCILAGFEARLMDGFLLRGAKKAFRGSIDAPMSSSNLLKRCRIKALMVSGGYCRHFLLQNFEHFSRYVALQAANNPLLGHALLSPTTRVFNGSRVGAKSHERDHPKGAVGIAVPATIKAMSILSAERSIDRRDTRRAAKDASYSGLATAVEPPVRTVSDHWCSSNHGVAFYATAVLHRVEFCSIS